MIFVEEPLPSAGHSRLELKSREEDVVVVVPHLSTELSPAQANAELERLLEIQLEQLEIERYVLWLYTPMAVACTRGLRPVAIVYDCMDELSAFAQAPPQLQELEDELFRIADLVFTGGTSLYEAKRGRHPDLHLFPSSVDTAHFAAARSAGREPEEQRVIPRPRLGYAGVIDERMDLALLAALAAAEPTWQLILIGPVAKIDPDALPQAPNIHYLGQRPYADLPAYLRGWDVALLPFARNESTRLISPTKTPEYLAAGLPVVSTPIADVVRPYGDRGDHVTRPRCDRGELSRGRSEARRDSDPRVVAASIASALVLCLAGTVVSPRLQRGDLAKFRSFGVPAALSALAYPCFETSTT